MDLERKIDMAIRTGDKAVGFQLPAKPGDMVDVGAHIGSDKVVLLFFPLAFSPVCTAEMCGMRDAWDQYSALDAKVYGISIDSPFVTEKFRSEENIPFPLLSDFNRDVARQYDVLHADLKGMKDVAKRSVFVINNDGQVVYDWISDDPGQQIDFSAIQAALKG
jgi:peroxiredoxin